MRIPLLCFAAVPAVLQDIYAAAALGIGTEVALPKGGGETGTSSSESLRSQFAGERGFLVTQMECWGSIIRAAGPTAALVGDMAMHLLSHMSRWAGTGLGRSVGFCCNEPRCWNLEGLSEVGLVLRGVQGGSRAEGQGVCGQSKAAYYCSRYCEWRSSEGGEG
jgi:hypothetical protein